MCTYAYPASIAQAELHAQATKFGYRADLKDRVPTVCPCCMFRIDSEPLSICESTTSISA